MGISSINTTKLMIRPNAYDAFLGIVAKGVRVGGSGNPVRLIGSLDTDSGLAKMFLPASIGFFNPSTAFSLAIFALTPIGLEV